MTEPSFKDGDGLNTVKELKMEMKNENNLNTYMINVNNFESLYKHNSDQKFIKHNIFDGSKVKKKIKSKIGMNLFGKKTVF